MIACAITREDLAALPIRRYEGEVNVVTKPAELERAMEDIRAQHVVGFDTQTRPAFKKGESYLPCLMQVATARRVHVLQLSRVDCSAAAAELLGSGTIVKAGIGLSYDLGQLERLFPFDSAAVLDLGEAVKRLGFQQSGVRNLAAIGHPERARRVLLVPRDRHHGSLRQQRHADDQRRSTASTSRGQGSHCREHGPR